MALSFAIPGSTLKVYVNSQLLGWVTGIPTWTITTEWARIREIDSSITRQLVPRSYTVSGTLQVVRGRYTGGAEGAGLIPSAENMLRQKYLTIEVQDITTQDIVYRAKHCQVMNQTWRIDGRGVVTGTLNFEGLTFESEDIQ